jgi:tricarballylate dehydrogenase
MARHGIDWELHMSHVAKVKGKYIWRSGTIPVAARGGGHGLQEMHFKHVESRAIEILYSARALGLSQDSSGAADGALVSTPAGKQRIRSKAVILACGGFESNPEMRARYLGQNWDLVKVRGTRYNTATASGWRPTSAPNLSATGAAATHPSSSTPKPLTSKPPTRPRVIPIPIASWST